MEKDNYNAPNELYLKTCASINGDVLKKECSCNTAGSCCASECGIKGSDIISPPLFSLIIKTLNEKLGQAAESLLNIEISMSQIDGSCLPVYDNDKKPPVDDRKDFIGCMENIINKLDTLNSKLSSQSKNLKNLVG